MQGLSFTVKSTWNRTSCIRAPFSWDSVAVEFQLAFKKPARAVESLWLGAVTSCSAYWVWRSETFSLLSLSLLPSCQFSFWSEYIITSLLSWLRLDSPLRSSSGTIKSANSSSFTSFDITIFLLTASSSSHALLCSEYARKIGALLLLSRFLTSVLVVIYQHLQLNDWGLQVSVDDLSRCGKEVCLCAKP